MRVDAVKTRLIKPGDDLLEVLKETGTLDSLPERSVICVTSKVVSLEQRRLVELDQVEPSEVAQSLNQLKYSMDFRRYPGLAQLILEESEWVYEGRYVYLTLKDGMFIPNAGIDLSNVEEGSAILWPTEPFKWAAEFRRRLKETASVGQVGVLLTDSRCTPLRRGVIGLAMAYSGFEGVEDRSGTCDLFGRELRFTSMAVADDLACAGVLVMGEASERTPFAVIEGAPLTFTDRDIDSDELNIDPEIDLFAGLYDEKLFEALKGLERRR